MLIKNFFVQKPGSRKEKKASICENKYIKVENSYIKL